MNGPVDPIYQVWKNHCHYRSRAEHVMIKLQRFRGLREFGSSPGLLRSAVIVAANVLNRRLRMNPPYPGVYKPPPADW